MEFLGTDADFRAKSELETVRIAGSRVHIYAGSVYHLLKLTGVSVITGQDCFTVFGSITGNMVQGFVQPRHNFYRKAQIAVLCGPVFFRSRQGLFIYCADCFIADDLYTVLFEYLQHMGQEILHRVFTRIGSAWA